VRIIISSPNDINLKTVKYMLLLWIHPCLVQPRVSMRAEAHQINRSYAAFEATFASKIQLVVLLETSKSDGGSVLALQPCLFTALYMQTLPFVVPRSKRPDLTAQKDNVHHRNLCIATNMWSYFQFFNNTPYKETI
jgi:hypothetical protein